MNKSSQKSTNVTPFELYENFQIELQQLKKSIPNFNENFPEAPAIGELDKLSDIMETMFEKLTSYLNDSTKDDKIKQLNHQNVLLQQKIDEMQKHQFDLIQQFEQKKLKYKAKKQAYIGDLDRLQKEVQILRDTHDFQKSELGTNIRETKKHQEKMEIWFIRRLEKLELMILDQQNHQLNHIVQKIRRFKKKMPWKLNTNVKYVSLVNKNKIFLIFNSKITYQPQNNSQINDQKIQKQYSESRSTPFSNYSGFSSENAQSLDKTLNKGFIVTSETSRGSLKQSTQFQFLNNPSSYRNSEQNKKANKTEQNEKNFQLINGNQFTLQTDQVEEESVQKEQLNLSVSQLEQLMLNYLLKTERSQNVTHLNLKDVQLEDLLNVTQQNNSISLDLDFHKEKVKIQNNSFERLINSFTSKSLSRKFNQKAQVQNDKEDFLDQLSPIDNKKSVNNSLYNLGNISGIERDLRKKSITQDMRDRTCKSFGIFLLNEIQEECKDLDSPQFQSSARIDVIKGKARKIDINIQDQTHESHNFDESSSKIDENHLENNIDINDISEFNKSINSYNKLALIDNAHKSQIQSVNIPLNSMTTDSLKNFLNNIPCEDLCIGQQNEQLKNHIKSIHSNQKHSNTIVDEKSKQYKQSEIFIQNDSSDEQDFNKENDQNQINESLDFKRNSLTNKISEPQSVSGNKKYSNKKLNQSKEENALFQELEPNQNLITISNLQANENYMQSQIINTPKSQQRYLQLSEIYIKQDPRQRNQKDNLQSKSQEGHNIFSNYFKQKRNVEKESSNMRVLSNTFHNKFSPNSGDSVQKQNSIYGRYNGDIQPFLPKPPQNQQKSSNERNMSFDQQIPKIDISQEENGILKNMVKSCKNQDIQQIKKPQMNFNVIEQQLKLRNFNLQQKKDNKKRKPLRAKILNTNINSSINNSNLNISVNSSIDNSFQDPHTPYEQKPSQNDQYGQQQNQTDQKNIYFDINGIHHQLLLLEQQQSIQQKSFQNGNILNLYSPVSNINLYINNNNTKQCCKSKSPSKHQTIDLKDIMSPYSRGQSLSLHNGKYKNRQI